MSEAERREIEKEALKYAEVIKQYDDSIPYGLKSAYITGATRMAEKNNVEIERLKYWNTSMVEDDLKAQLEAAQEELEELKAKNFEMSDTTTKVVSNLQAELSRVKVENERKEEMINNFEEQILERNICNCRYDKEGDCDRFRKYKRLIQVGLPIIEEFAKHTTGIFKQKAEQALAEYQTLNEPKR